MKTFLDSERATPDSYTPPALGNGQLSLLVDAEGAQHPREYHGMVPGIRRAGFRYDTRLGDLVPFGYFTQSLAGLGSLARWWQDFDPADGLVECDCRYDDGTRIVSELFCPPRKNIVAIRKRVETERAAPLELRYAFAPRRARLDVRPLENGVRVEYAVEGMREYRGFVDFVCDRPAEFRREGEAFVLSTAARECAFFLRFDAEAGGPGSAEDFDALLHDARDDWRDYAREGHVRLPSPALQRVYDAAQYNLRIASTDWSVPTGIFDTHWRGLYFGFDEYFNLMGLLTSGHVDAALKIPRFRFSLLPLAHARINSSASPDTGAALYPWESDELGRENSLPGFWYDHIFHQAHIALSAWRAYRYSGDRAFLADEGYPVLRACVEYLRLFGVTHDAGGRRVVRVCTDLERLGPAISNPFMTSCSLVAAFEAAADAARRLGVDADRQREWLALARDLRASQPRENGRYVPYAGCRTASIALLAGLSPYATHSIDDPAQRGALAEYRRRRAECGNMYAMGRGVCSWYLGWEASALARAGQGDAALDVLEEVAAGCGAWGEMYEIGELGMRPYFTTACGMFVQALNELFVQDMDAGTNAASVADDLRLAPAVPSAWKDYAFRLQAPGGGKVEVVCEGGEIARRRVTPAVEKKSENKIDEEVA